MGTVQSVSQHQHAKAVAAPSSGSVGNQAADAVDNFHNESIKVECLSSAVVQVLEPAALDVCMTNNAQLHVLVTGRGTQLLVFA